MLLATGLSGCDDCQAGMGATCTTCSASHYILDDETCTTTLPSCPVTTWKMADATRSIAVVCPSCLTSRLSCVLPDIVVQARKAATTVRPRWVRNASHAPSTTILLRGEHARLLFRPARQPHTAAFSPPAPRLSCARHVWQLMSMIRGSHTAEQVRRAAATARRLWAPRALSAAS